MRADQACSFRGRFVELQPLHFRPSGGEMQKIKWLEGEPSPMEGEGLGSVGESSET